MNEWLLDILEEIDPETHGPSDESAEPANVVELDTE